MLNLIVAPFDYNDNGEKYAKRIVRYLKREKCEYSVYFSPSIDEMNTNVRNLTLDNETEFVVIGDKYILNQFLNSVENISKIKLGVIPLNKDDDFISYLDFETNPITAIRNILERQVKPVDYMIVNDKIVINDVLIGASVELYEIYSQYKIKNALTRNLVIMQYGSNYEGIELTFDTKTQKAKTETVFDLSISNGGYNGKKKQSPLANLSDGLFNLNYVNQVDREERKKYLKLFNKGAQIYDERTHQYWLNRVKITNADARIKALVDGQIVNYESLEVSVVEGGLQLYNTKTNEIHFAPKPEKKIETKPLEEIEPEDEKK